MHVKSTVQGMKVTTVSIDKSTRQELKILAAVRGVTMGELIAQLLTKEHEKDPTPDCFRPATRPDGDGDSG